MERSEYGRESSKDYTTDFQSWDCTCWRRWDGNMTSPEPGLIPQLIVGRLWSATSCIKRCFLQTARRDTSTRLSTSYGQILGPWNCWDLTKRFGLSANHLGANGPGTGLLPQAFKQTAQALNTSACISTSKVLRSLELSRCTW